MIPKFTLGDRLRKARMAKGLTLEELADALDMSRQGINNYELDLSVPKFATVRAWAKETEVPAHWLLWGVSEEPRGPIEAMGREALATRRNELRAAKLPRLDSNQQPAGYGTWHARPAASVHDLASKRKRVAEVQSAPRVRRHGEQAAA